MDRIQLSIAPRWLRAGCLNNKQSKKASKRPFLTNLLLPHSSPFELMSHQSNHNWVNLFERLADLSEQVEHHLRPMDLH